MRVYRVCNIKEAQTILSQRSFDSVGIKQKNDSKKSTHRYQENINYMHFLDTELSLLYLHPKKGSLICVYDIPIEIANESKGIGLYLDFIFLKNIQEVNEYAIESSKIKFEYLKTIYEVEEDLDFDYVPEKSELYENMRIVCDLKNN